MFTNWYHSMKLKQKGKVDIKWNEHSFVTNELYIANRNDIDRKPNQPTLNEYKNKSHRQNRGTENMIKGNHLAILEIFMQASEYAKKKNKKQKNISVFLFIFLKIVIVVVSPLIYRPYIFLFASNYSFVSILILQRCLLAIFGRNRCN